MEHMFIVYWVIGIGFVAVLAMIYTFIQIKYGKAILLDDDPAMRDVFNKIINEFSESEQDRFKNFIEDGAAPLRDGLVEDEQKNE